MTIKNNQLVLTRRFLYHSSAVYFFIAAIWFVLETCKPAVNPFIRTIPTGAFVVYWTSLSLYAGHLISQKPDCKKVGQYFAIATVIEYVLLLLWYTYPITIFGYYPERMPENIFLNTIIVGAIFVGKKSIGRNSIGAQLIDKILDFIPIKVAKQPH
jgi:hypothetical protein